MSNEPQNTNTLRIKQMDSDARPRERAKKHGIKSLSDAELIAVLLSTGLRGKSVLDLSREIIEAKDGRLSKVARMELRDFTTQFKGIGEAKALTLLAALELGARAAKDAAVDPGGAIRSAADAYAYMKEKFQWLAHEEFWVLMLSRANRPLCQFRVGQGGLTSTVVDVKVLMRRALQESCSSMMLFHNHPSGNLKPSPQDIQLTQKISQAAAMFDIRVLDHLIITDNAYYSFHDEGSMP